MRHLEEYSEPSEAEEAISAAALQYEGELFTGRSHAEALGKLEAEKPHYDIDKVKDGFVTNKNRFVGREEALQLAKNTKQVTSGPFRRSKNLLSSEDVMRFE